MNVQFAIQGTGTTGVVYVLEVNPRASRTVPFVSKATGAPLAKIAARCMVGQTLADQQRRRRGEVVPPYFSVKEAVFPFIKFPGVDTILGPEMKSTGEVMGVGRTFGEALVKCQLGAGSRLPTKGTVVHQRARTPTSRARSRSRATCIDARLRARRPPAARRRRSPRPASRCTPSTRSRKAGRTSST